MRGLLLLLALLLFSAPALADTGTYVIEKYEVTLTPHADGQVGIEVSQRWRVTGGHIPWITVGLPNSDFTIVDSGGAVRSIAPQGDGGWSGVRIDLDRDYQPGQNFEISFAVKQSKLFYAEGENYRLDYWPGWYDNAETESLTIRLKHFVAPDSITAEPTPTERSDTELVWSGMRLGRGEKYEVHVSFPKTAAPQAIPEGELRSEEERAEQEPYQGDYSGSSGPGVGFMIFFIALIIFIIWLRWRMAVEGYSGGGIWYGGGGDSGAGSSGGRRTGGGGGFGGGGFSCVCACVSCACACACAGGGGAGCSRKLRHTCPRCEEAPRA